MAYSRDRRGLLLLWKQDEHSELWSSLDFRVLGGQHLNWSKIPFWWGILIITVLGFTEGERMHFQTRNYPVLSTSSEKKTQASICQDVFAANIFVLVWSLVFSVQCHQMYFNSHPVVQVQCVASQQGLSSLAFARSPCICEGCHLVLHKQACEANWEFQTESSRESCTRMDGCMDKLNWVTLRCVCTNTAIGDSLLDTKCQALQYIQYKDMSRKVFLN